VNKEFWNFYDLCGGMLCPGQWQQNYEALIWGMGGEGEKSRDFRKEWRI